MSNDLRLFDLTFPTSCQDPGCESLSRAVAPVRLGAFAHFGWVRNVAVVSPVARIGDLCYPSERFRDNHPSVQTQPQVRELVVGRYIRLKTKQEIHTGISEIESRLEEE